MTFRRSLQVAVAAAVLVSPLAAFAQVVAAVTTGPLGQSAPVLALPILVGLVMALIGLGIYSLRTRSARAASAFALVAGLSLLAGLSYANGGVVVQGAECNTRTVQPYNSGGSTLTSLCPNPIQIIAIECNAAPGIVFAPSLPPCSIGQTLTNGQECALPGCIT